MVHSNEASWSWFEKTMDGSAENKEEDARDLPGLFARCFRGVEGEKVLSHLAEMTLGRPLGANAHNGILRHLEGQRYLVSYIMGMVRQGRQG